MGGWVEGGRRWVGRWVGGSREGVGGFWRERIDSVDGREQKRERE